MKSRGLSSIAILLLLFKYSNESAMNQYEVISQEGPDDANADVVSFDSLNDPNNIINQSPHLENASNLEPNPQQVSSSPEIEANTNPLLDSVVKAKYPNDTWAYIDNDGEAPLTNVLTLVNLIDQPPNPGPSLQTSPVMGPTDDEEILGVKAISLQPIDQSEFDSLRGTSDDLIDYEALRRIQNDLKKEIQATLSDGFEHLNLNKLKNTLKSIINYEDTQKRFLNVPKSTAVLPKEKASDPLGKVESIVQNLSEAELEQQKVSQEQIQHQQINEPPLSPQLIQQPPHAQIIHPRPEAHSQLRENLTQPSSELEPMIQSQPLSFAPQQLPPRKPQSLPQSHQPFIRPAPVPATVISQSQSKSQLDQQKDQFAQLQLQLQLQNQIEAQPQSISQKQFHPNQEPHQTSALNQIIEPNAEFLPVSLEDELPVKLDELDHFEPGYLLEGGEGEEKRAEKKMSEPKFDGLDGFEKLKTDEGIEESSGDLESLSLKDKELKALKKPLYHLDRLKDIPEDVDGNLQSFGNLLYSPFVRKIPYGDTNAGDDNEAEDSSGSTSETHEIIADFSKDRKTSNQAYRPDGKGSFEDKKELNSQSENVPFTKLERSGIKSNHMHSISEAMENNGSDPDVYQRLGNNRVTFVFDEDNKNVSAKKYKSQDTITNEFYEPEKVSFGKQSIHGKLIGPITTSNSDRNGTSQDEMEFVSVSTLGHPSSVLSSKKLKSKNNEVLRYTKKDPSLLSTEGHNKHYKSKFSQFFDFTRSNAMGQKEMFSKSALMGAVIFLGTLIVIL